jgi:hypothetical protein
VQSAAAAGWNVSARLTKERIAEMRADNNGGWMSRMDEDEALSLIGGYLDEALAAYEASVTPRWTREPPTKPGWYWAARRNERGEQATEAVHITVVFKHTAVACAGGVNRAVGDFDLWAGPIEAAPLPEGT